MKNRHMLSPEKSLNLYFIATLFISVVSSITTFYFIQSVEILDGTCQKINSCSFLYEKKGINSITHMAISILCAPALSWKISRAIGGIRSKELFQTPKDGSVALASALLSILTCLSPHLIPYENFNSSGKFSSLVEMAAESAILFGLATGLHTFLCCMLAGNSICILMEISRE